MAKKSLTETASPIKIWGEGLAGKKVFQDMEVVATPSGAKCHYCRNLIAEGQSGFSIDGSDPIHRECHARLKHGSVGHLTGRCSCSGGTTEDPEGLSKREAAIASYYLGMGLSVQVEAIGLLPEGADLADIELVPVPSLMPMTQVRGTGKSRLPN